MVNVDSSTADIMEYNKYIGSGSVGNRNNTVSADSMREVQVSMSINPDSANMERFNLAEQDGNVHVFLYGTLWYRMVNYPDASQRMDGIYYMNSVVVRHG